MSQDSLNEDVSVASEEAMSAAQANYVACQNSKRVLVAMSIGMGDSHKIDVDKAPFTVLPRREVKPLLNELRGEVKRRSADQGSPTKPNNWTASQCMKWLNENPVSVEADRR